MEKPTEPTSKNEKSIFDEIEEERQKQNGFVRIQPNEKVLLQFVTVPEKEKIRIVPSPFKDPKTGEVTNRNRVQYTVIDPKSPTEERKLELSLRSSSQLNALLKKGLKLIEIHRMGAGTATQYLFTPV